MRRRWTRRISWAAGSVKLACDRIEVSQILCAPHTSLESFNGLRARLETHSQWDCASSQASAKEHPACLTLLLYEGHPLHPFRGHTFCSKLAWLAETIASSVSQHLAILLPVNSAFYSIENLGRSDFRKERSLGFWSNGRAAQIARFLYWLVI